MGLYAVNAKSRRTTAADRGMAGTVAIAYHIFTNYEYSISLRAQESRTSEEKSIQMLFYQMENRKCTRMTDNVF